MQTDALFRRAFENASIGMGICALEDGAVLMANRALCRMLGYSEQELLGRHFQDVTHPDDRGESDARFARLLSGEIDSYDIEMRYVTKTGELRWVDLRVSLVCSDEGVPLFALGQIVDITDRRRAEEQLAERREEMRQLERYERLEAVGQLAGGIAHDFNNLLAVVLNYSALLERELQDPEQVELASEIRQAAERAAELTRDLLAIGRRSPVKRVPLEVSALLDGVRSRASDRFPDGITLHTAVSDQTPALLGDHDLVEQMLLALAQNAAEAMPAGGTVSISGSAVEVTDPRGQPRPGHYVLLSVRDAGVGMTESVSARAFEPFFTTKPKSESAGLGLATVYGTVRRSGGHVQIHSQPGQGTTVDVHMPVAEGRPAPSAESEAPQEGAATVLLVDDEPALLRLGRRVLEGAGFAVLEACDPADAVEVMDEHEGKIDLLATDVVMPGSSGIELARRARELRPALPVLFISGYADDVIARVGELGEQDGFLAKPYEADDLVRAARSALADAR